MGFDLRTLNGGMATDLRKAAEEAVRKQQEEGEDCGACEDNMASMLSFVRAPMRNASSGKVKKVKKEGEEDGVTRLPVVEDEDDDEDDWEWEMAPPPGRASIGRATWTMLHSISVHYPENPSEEQKAEMEAFLKSMSKVYPCKVCRDDLSEQLVLFPPQLDSRKEYATWMCDLHNRVNLMLGKPEFDCSLVFDRWRYVASQVPKSL